MEGQILNTAIEEFQKQTDITVHLKQLQGLGNQHFDAELDFVKGKQRWTFNVDVKTKIVPTQLHNEKVRNELEDPYIIIADYISKPAKEILKERNIAYMDTLGNTYIDMENLYIYIETNKTNRGNQAVQNRAFKKAGLKVVYQFLVHPDYINKPYRFVAENAKVTIDTVGKVIKDLVKQRYLVQRNDKEYQVQDMKRLFEDWVNAYNKNLRPKLKQRNYRFVDKTIDWQNVILPENTHWGGAVEAERLDNYLIPQDGVLYTGADMPKLIKEMKIVPDNNGPIKVYEKFWNQIDQEVHPILVYADLINTEDPRYIEAAAKIYKNYVERYI
ncbi:type IV toxin-antitoxin system AbiEi family antitoxin [Flavobacteriales bacterium]|nr:type IV toxin-antitoxin system AbiEi family antitoxin [Flavobacteriales bacterium]